MCFMPRRSKASVKVKFSQAKSKPPTKISILTSGDQLMCKGHTRHGKEVYLGWGEQCRSLKIWA